MHNAAAGNVSIQSGDRSDGHRSIVSDLRSLIEHVQASIALIEGALAQEAALGNQDVPANVVVLDDVTPRYLKTSAALSTCRAGLGVALHVLLDASASGHHPAGGFSAGDHRPVHLAGRA
jgi:hypothetical protein